MIKVKHICNFLSESGSTTEIREYSRASISTNGKIDHDKLEDYQIDWMKFLADTPESTADYDNDDYNSYYEIIK